MSTQTLVKQLKTIGGNVVTSLSNYDFRKYPFIKYWQDSVGKIPETTPWLHQEIENFLPGEIANLLNKKLPKIPKPSASPSRSWLTLESKAQKLDPLCDSEHEQKWWGGAVNILELLTYLFQDRQTFTRLYSPFAPYMSNRILPNLDHIYVQIRLNHDREDYHLDVHTDIPEKFLTVLVYLPQDNLNQKGGTSLYTPKELFLDKLSRKQYGFYSADWFHRKKIIPFTFNRALIFPPTNETWHGKPLDDQETRPDRFTLQINYFVMQSIESRVIPIP